ncbi:hypothetical protein V9T40_004672 [Parthenolecanium corni]|uniref:Uncharacterized protein n=1 Tax=Parthenolecanium corni TaxID=536013 RepID=A0AAN9TGF7_9HEMI
MKKESCRRVKDGVGGPAGAGKGSRSSGLAAKRFAVEMLGFSALSSAPRLLLACSALARRPIFAPSSPPHPKFDSTVDNRKAQTQFIAGLSPV